MNSNASDSINVDITGANNQTLLHHEDYNYYDSELTLWFDKIKTLWVISGPVILTLGTFGNVTIILVLRKMISEASAFPLLFMALAISDLLLLYVRLLPGWAGQQFGYWIINESDVSCKLVSWLEYSLSALSAWFLTAMTTYRALSVTWPLQMREVRPKRQAVLTIAVLAVVSFGVGSPALFGTSTDLYAGVGFCQWKNDFKIFLLILPWLELLQQSLMPSVVMVICNCIMIRALLRLSRRPNVQSSTGSGAMSVTSTLIAVSVAFLFLTLPFHVTRIIGDQIPELIQDGPFRFWYNVTSLMWALNSAINIFLYMLPGSRFREEVKKLFCNAETTQPNQQTATLRC